MTGVDGAVRGLAGSAGRSRMRFAVPQPVVKEIAPAITSDAETNPAFRRWLALICCLRAQRVTSSAKGLLHSKSAMKGTFLNLADWIGIAALVVSAATLAYVLADDLRRRRRIGPVRIELNPLGWGVDDQGPFEAIEMVNGGLSGARITWLCLVGCALDQTMESRIRWDLGPGEKVLLHARPTLSGEDPWFVVAYSTTDDVRWVHVEWWPMMSGPLREVWMRQAEAQRAWRSRWFPWLSAERNVIGPEGATSVRVRGARGRLLQILVRTQEAMPTGHVSYLAGARGRGLGRPPQNDAALVGHDN